MSNFAPNYIIRNTKPQLRRLEDGEENATVCFTNNNMSDSHTNYQPKLRTTLHYEHLPEQRISLWDTIQNKFRIVCLPHHR